MSELDLLAGIIGSDGHLDKDQPVIRIINKNKEFLEEIAKPILEKFTGKKIKLSNSISGFGKKRYLIIVYDRRLWKVMNEKYGIPAGNKSTKIRLPENLSSKAQMDFLLGWIAGDGSITFDRTRTKIEIWSKSKDILFQFKNLLEKQEIESKIFNASKERYILRISKINSVKSFYKKFQIPHPEKQRKLSILAFQQFRTS